MKEFTKWLQSSELGQYLIQAEQVFYDKAVSDVFGFRALQVGLVEYDLLKENRIKCQFKMGRFDGAACCNPVQLPIESDSLDLLVLPHGLDFTEHPHQVIREAERVLVPEGRLVLTGFNPYSLWGMRRATQGRVHAPWSGRFLSLARLKDWFELMQLDPSSGAFMCYAPPFNKHDWLHAWRFMESAGDRWWPLAAGVYGITAVKRQKGMHLITPKWRVKKPAINLVVAGSEQHTVLHDGDKPE